MSDWDEIREGFEKARAHAIRAQVILGGGASLFTSQAAMNHFVNGEYQAAELAERKQRQFEDRQKRAQIAAMMPARDVQSYLEQWDFEEDQAKGLYVVKGEEKEPEEIQAIRKEADKLNRELSHVERYVEPWYLRLLRWFVNL